MKFSLKMKDFFAEADRLGSERNPFFFLLDFEMEKPLILRKKTQTSVLMDIGGQKNFVGESAIEKPEKFHFNKFPMDYQNYREAFEIIHQEFIAGNTFLLNLTFPTRVETDLTLEDFFHLAKAKYRVLIPEEMAVFSPERFVRIENNRIFSTPMKGTISAVIPEAENRILNDEKELAEHVTIVDLIRNDLSRIARNVKVEKFRYIDKVENKDGGLLQVSSLISGELDQNWNSRLGTILESLLPAGSVTGAPKEKTLEIIRKAEGRKRGYYTGIAGYFDGHSLDSGVMIRYIERTENSLYYRSGGGLTYDSVCLREYEEMVNKIYAPFC